VATHELVRFDGGICALLVAAGSTANSQPPTPEEKALGRRCLLCKYERENSEDVEGTSLGDRKKGLGRLLGRRRIGIVLSDHRRHRVEAAERALPIGPVSRLVEGQNPESPTMIRAREKRSGHRQYSDGGYWPEFH
jgi:hypothetical protein